MAQGTAPGKNMKPMFDGTFKEAGAHPDEFVLEHENGARALIRTYGGNVFSYITKDGVQGMYLFKLSAYLMSICLVYLFSNHT